MFEALPSEVMGEDFGLLMQIVAMRRFDRVFEKSKKQRKDMTPEDWKYLEAVDAEVNG